MSIWQSLNAPRNKRELRVAKIARDLERQRILEIIESGVAGCDGEGSHYYCTEICDIEKFIALIKGNNK